MSKRNLFRLLPFLITIILIQTFLYAEEDVKGSKDHPVISRFPGSYIYHYYQKDYDEFHLLLGPVRSVVKKDLENAKEEKIEGKVTLIQYQVPKERAPMKFSKTTKGLLKRLGFRSFTLVGERISRE